MSVRKRLLTEWVALMDRDPTSIKSDSNDLFCGKATIIGPIDTPYAEGIFELEFRFPDDYPFKPPRIWFITPIYHFNVNDRGGIDLDLLKDRWSPTMTISDVLDGITALLVHPNIANPLVSDIAKLYQQNRELHDRNALEWTLKYAVTDQSIERKA